MAPKAHETAQQFVLPAIVTGPVELGRLLREVETADETLLQADLRSHGKEDAEFKASKTLRSVLELNHFKLEDEADRRQLIQQLQDLKAKAPVLHMSLAADPTSAFTDKIVDWMRREIDPYALLTVGLQPNIGAGCMLRTTSKYFDMSLRQGFESKKALLINYVAAKQGAPK